MLFSRPLSLLATTILLSTPVVHALLSSTGEKFLPSGAAALSVNFKVSGSQEELKLDVDGKTTIADLKTHIAEKSGTLAADGLKIIFKGRILKDADTVEGSGITSGVTCHVVGVALVRPSRGVPSREVVPSSSAMSVAEFFLFRLVVAMMFDASYVLRYYNAGRQCRSPSKFFLAKEYNTLIVSVQNKS